MSDGSSKLSVKSVAADARKIAENRVAKKEESTAGDARFADITQANVFASIMLNPEISPEVKRDEVVKALTFSKESSKEENRAKLEAFMLFKEYLQEQRKVLNREGIKLQDTEAFAELQTVIDEMTKASIEFQDRAKPLIDVLNAVFEIRKEDKIRDVYQEIQKDKEWEEEQSQTLQKFKKDLEAHRAELNKLEQEKARLSCERSLFGLGPITRAAQGRIAEIDEVETKRLTAAISETTDKIRAQRELLQTGRDTNNRDLIQQKAVLREFLDLTKDENRDRQKALIEAAVRYVDTSDQRLKSVLKTLERLGKHAEVVSDANGMLRNIHLIMDDSLKGVSVKNAEQRDELGHTVQEESSIAKMTREDKLNDLNEYIARIDEGAIDVANSIGGLTKHSVQIQAYKDTLRNESASTKRLHLEGVSQMGEQLMSVVSAISAAATSESRSIAANNFAKMAEQNQTIVSQEVVRNATTVEIEANHISRLVGELQDYGDVLNASSQIASQGYDKMRDTISAIRKVSGAVQGAIDTLISERADAGMATPDKPTSSIREAGNSGHKASGGFDNPFDKFVKS